MTAQAPRILWYNVVSKRSSYHCNISNQLLFKDFKGSFLGISLYSLAKHVHPEANMSPRILGVYAQLTQLVAVRSERRKCALHHQERNCDESADSQHGENILVIQSCNKYCYISFGPVWYMQFIF